MQLDPIAVASGARLLALANVGSTNEEARLRARRGERGPLWITAAAQTAGRGRLDRSWVSPEGNLYASLLLSEPSPLERAPELGFVAALALRDAVVALAPALAPRLRFKWPNDLLHGRDKCAGILIEGEVGTDRSTAIVIGIGVNCATHPATEADRPATHLSAHLGSNGSDITPQRLFRELSATMCRRIETWDRGSGFSAILDDWIAAAGGIGEDITVRNGTSEKHGRFAGLDRSGRLVLELHGGGTDLISAGDVFPFDIAGDRAVRGRN
jgi:BirA family biotin operon repressor/biotin-[acetyl-CoA-carboxylase] ligase